MKANEFLRIKEFRLFIPELLILLVFLFAFTSPSLAQDFSARQLADYGNVTVMEVSGSFDELLADGSENVTARQSIAKEFFRTHKDEYDTLVIFTNFDYKMKPDGRVAFFTHVKNDVRGISQQIYDNSTLYGSNGRLYGTIDMGNLQKLSTNPLDSKFDFSTDTLIHETLHRWSAYVKFKDWNGATSKATLGQDDAHWSFLLDSGGSTLYGNKWNNNGDGTFTSTAVRRYYSPIDLYLMGMIDKSKVPPTLLIDNPSIDPARMPEIGATIGGTARYVNVDDIIAVEGERVPGVKDSPKQFKTAFIYAVTPGSFNGDDLYGIENLRNAYLTRFSILTDGKGVVQVASTVKDDLPANPGIRPPSLIPRTLPPNIDSGVSWLLSHQQTEGSWTDYSLTSERDTAETITTLQHYPAAAQSYKSGLDWLGSNASANTDYLARRIEAAVQTGGNSSSYVQELLARRNVDGGWGGNRNFISSATDTALALKGLAVAGYNDIGVTKQAIAYLQGTQNADGGWSGDDAFSTIQPTAAVVTAFNLYRKSFSLEDNLSRGIAFLAAKQNSDGGFGNSPSTIYDSALAIIALQAAGADKAMIGRGTSYLLGQQSDNGAWFDSSFQTALAVRAVWSASVDPDLSISPDNISIIPDKVTTLPTNAVLSATVWNLGRTDVATATVAVYDGVVTPEKKVTEQTAAFPGQSPVTLTFSIPVTDSKGHVFHVVVDPDNKVSEATKNNNSAIKPLSPEITYDFQVLAGDITVTPSPVDIGTNVKIALKVSNSGTSDAYNVPVRVFINQQGAQIDIATLFLDISAGGYLTREIDWKAALAGTDLPLTVQIDPDNSFAEISKNNNIASIPITVKPSTLPNLSVSYKDMTITPTPVREGGSASISVLVKNDGYSSVENVKVNIFKGVSAIDSTLLGSPIIPVIAAGQSVRVNADWAAIAESGARIISVQADPDNTIQEIARDDNFTFTTLDILSLPDLAISANSVVVNPGTPKTGGQVTVAVTVQNAGDQEVRDVVVRGLEDGNVIGSSVIPLVNGNSQAIAEIAYTNSGKSGTHQISVVVDPDNSIVERTKDNNSAVKIFRIQDANLWLTEAYISPNGDGIKDSTDFSFRLAAADKVVVQIVSNKGDVVRTFSGGELDNTTGSSINWDGKNDGGSVVEDGIYQLKVAGASNAVLASLPVEVDTNRSPLTDAIGTKYLLQSNQTCMLPNFSNLKWLPDESGLTFNLANDANSPYLDGIYSMAPNGDDIVRLMPDSWNSRSNPDVSYGFDVQDRSPDGRKMVFQRAKTTRTLAGYYWYPYYPYYRYSNAYSLWSVNIDGSNLTQLVDERQNTAFDELKWSPDGSRIAVLDVSGLRVLNPETKTMSTPVSGSGGYAGHVFWSQDGTQVATSYYNPVGVAIVDANGNGNFVNLNLNDQYASIVGWMAGNRVLISGYNYNANSYQPSIFNPADNNIMNLDVNYQNYSDITISFDGRYAFARKNIWNEDVTSISLVDSAGNVAVAAEHTKDGNAPILGEANENITGIGASSWSSNDDRIAYVDTSYNQLTGLFHDDLVVYDAIKQQNLRISVSDYQVKDFYNGKDDRIQQFKWMKDNVHFLVTNNMGTYVLNSADGSHSDFLPLGQSFFFELSPNERYLAYEKYDDAGSSCYSNKWFNQWAMSSLLNLTADLRIVKNKSYVMLRGIASDKSFEGYRLEYADTKTPWDWNLVAPPSDIPIVNDNFATWVPPYEGSFLVRLTVWDKAGNQAVDRKQLNWGVSSLITNLYKTEEYISPNGDGIKDVVELHYKVLEPVHLEFNVFDSANNLVRSFSRDHNVSTSDFIVWDGKDSTGRLVPDGQYRISLFDYDFFVRVDTTLPSVSIGFDALKISKNPKGVFYASIDLLGTATDSNIKRWLVEIGEGDNPQSWDKYSEGNNELIALDDQGKQTSAIITKYFDDNIGSFKGKRFKITAEDFAGNRSSMLSDFVEERIMFISLDDAKLLNRNSLHIDTLNAGIHKFVVYETLKLATARKVLQYRIDSQWIDSRAIERGVNAIEWDTSQLNWLAIKAFRMKVVDALGGENFSEEIVIDEDKFSVGVECGTGGGSYIGVIYNKSNPLGVLKLQISQDNGATWNEVSRKIYDNIYFVEDAVAVPQALYNPSDYAKLRVRMVAETRNGDVYIDPPSKGMTFPIECQAVVGHSIDLAVTYDEATACNSLSPGKAKVVVTTSPNDFIPDSLNLTIKNLTGEVKLLQDFGKSSHGSVTIDTSTMPEGRYKATATVAYTSILFGEVKHEVKTAEKEIIVNRTLPQVQFDYPLSTGLPICPFKEMDSQRGVLYGVELKGSADSAIGIRHYDVYSGQGAEPASWNRARRTHPDLMDRDYGEFIRAPGAGSGSIGFWDVTGLKETYALQLRATDTVGNLGCVTTSFYLNEPVTVSSISPDRQFISSSIGNSVGAGYQLTGSATVGIQVYPVLSSPEQKDTLGSPIVRTIADGVHYLSGVENTIWDGRNDGGEILPEGKYGLTINSLDACQLTDTKWANIEIDNTLPIAAISYPLPGDPLTTGNIIEVKGTTTDQHFKSYLLEAGEGASPSVWIPISQGTISVLNAKLAAWNTFGLKDQWTLRLTVLDAAGNTSVTTSTINLGPRQSLIKTFAIAPDIFSPNGDQKRDLAHMTYEVTDASQIKIDVISDTGSIIRTFAGTSSGAATGYFDWDGRTSAMDAAPDGIYTIRMSAALTGKPEVNQTETITITVDTTPPEVVIPIPADKAFYNKTQMPVSGSITDSTLTSYSVAVTGPAGTTVLDSGNQNRAGYTFGMLNDMSEDNYALTVDAKDQGENTTKVVRTFTIDRTPPKVTLDAPKTGEFYGSTKNVIDISGAIIEKNLERYSLRYGVGDTPVEWKEVVGGDTVPVVTKLSSWKVGKDDGVADGVYTLSLYAKDKAGLEGEAKVRLVVDNTLPEVAITMPTEVSFLTKASDIKGTLSDINLDKGTLELAEGSCATAVKWAALKTITTSIKDGVIDSWKLLPSDGDYCLRLSAIDKSGNKAETKVGFKIDTHPPAPPKLSGKTENKTTNNLSWTKNPEPDFAGYNLYRDGQKLNASIITTEPVYLDANLKEGSYVYTVKAVDAAGNESDPSNAVTLKIDLAGPSVRISSPRDGSTISNLVDIKGTAFSQDDFKEYRVYIGQGSSPSSWNLIRRSPLAISYGTLGQWDTISYQDGTQLNIKLEAEDTLGNISSIQTLVTIDNTPPKAPVLMSAIGNGADVALTWKANSEADLAGYLLSRNDQLANVTGIVAWNLKPYLVTGTSYGDKTLPDGLYRYYLSAMDQAGNTSEQSNVLEVDIDNHPPHMTITTPYDGGKFEARLMVMAETPDNDIASVQFQYKKSQDASWVNLGPPVAKAPYGAYFDPKGASLPYGDYQLQAVATDRHNNVDPSPMPVAVNYTDLTPPDVPASLAAKVNGADVNLSWSAVSEVDVSYSIYRWSAGSRSMVNNSPLKTNSFVDAGVADGLYQYEVTATDIAGNESLPSTKVSAKVYTPAIIQPYTPVKAPALSLIGTGVDPNALVDITIVKPSGTSSMVSVTADAAGAFKLEGITLDLGETSFTAVTSDSNGNISKNSETVYVAYGTAPTAPTGLASTVQGMNVTLNWNANPEPDILGYYLYRNGDRLNDWNWVEPIFASASDETNAPAANSIDGDDYSSWSNVPSSDGKFAPVWWQMNFASPELISELDLNWYTEWDYNQNKQILFAARDFEIQAWSGHNWITIKKVVDNDQQFNEMLFDTPYRTDGLRLLITATTDPNPSKQVMLTGASAYSDDINTTPTNIDYNIRDGKYLYEVSAVNRYGFISDRSALNVKVGAYPQPPTGLTATVQGSDVLLNWDPNPAADGVIYNQLERWNGETMDNSWWIDVSNPSFLDSECPNGNYRYRVNALTLGNNGWLESDYSSDAFASVYTEPPSAPSKPGVTSMPEGKALKISWQPVAGVNSYSVYRSIVSGGAYARVAIVNSSEVYVDTGLINGTRYYYAITANDQFGNESIHSSEASGIPRDMIAQLPTIFQPTVPGAPVTVTEGSVRVSGFAEPGAQVNISRGDVQAGSAIALSQDVRQDQVVSVSAGRASLSPDGTILAYINDEDSYLELLNLPDNTKVTIPTVAGLRYLDYWSAPKWSPDGRYLIMNGSDYNRKSKVVLYDRNNDVMQTISTGETVNDDYAVWSPKGDAIIFVGNHNSIWQANPTDRTAVLITNASSYTFNPLMSPDGSRLAFSDTDSKMFIYSLVDKGFTLIDENAVAEPSAWSPDGSRLAFTSYRDGDGDIYTYNLADGSITRRTSSQQDGYSLIWSPDGAQLGYATYPDNNELFWIVDINGHERKVFEANEDLFAVPEWRGNGVLTLLDNLGIHNVTPAGYFSLAQANLVPGENHLSANEIDESGNVSRQSDSITVVIDTGTLPDLAVTANDIMIYPPFPKPGDDVLVTARVNNLSGNAASNVKVALYLWDGSQDLITLVSEEIPYIGANGEGSVSIRFNAGNVMGTRTIIAVIDQDNHIPEVSEMNNYATRDIVVTNLEKVEVTSSLNAPAYTANQDLSATVKLGNSGLPKSVNLSVAIEDASGALVKLLNNQSMELPYGYNQGLTFAWNTGATFNGSYRLHTVLRDEAAVLTDDSIPFQILPDLNLLAGLVTDRQQYVANQNVGMTVSFKNIGVNYLIPQLRVMLHVLDSQHAEVYSAENTASNLMPAASCTQTFIWNTAFNSPGSYSVVMEIYAGDVQVATGTANFIIIPTMKVGGVIKADPAVAQLGSSFMADYLLSSIGNTAVSGTASLALIDPETLAVVASSDQPAAIPLGGSVSGSVKFSTDGLKLKTYLLRLNFISSGSSATIAATLLAVKDGVAPELIVSTLADGSVTNNATLNITGTVTDNVGVKELAINGNVIPVLADGSYSHALSLVPGKNQIAINAVDLSGNSVRDIRTIHLDQTAPKLVITSPVDNSKTGEANTIVTGYVDEASIVAVNLVSKDNVRVAQSVTMNGNSFTAMVELEPQWNTIEVIATDVVSNASSDKRSVFYDDLKPAIAITSPDRDIRTNVGNITIKGTASDPYGLPVTVSIDMNGQTFTPEVINGQFEQVVSFAAENTYNIVATATTSDVQASSTTQRNVIYDITPPILTIDSVVTPTNRYPAFLSGTMEEGATVTIASSTAATGPVEYPAATTWRTPVSTLSEDLNTFTVTAVDVAGNIAVATTGIDYDISPPSGNIVINGGAAYSASTQVSLALSAGDRSGVATMRFSGNGTTWTIPETYAVSRNWDFAAGEGSQRVYVQYLDNAGNWSDAISAAITLDTTSPSVSVDPVGGIYGAAQSVNLTASEPTAIYYTLDGSTPTTLSARYSAPLTIASDTTLKSLAIDLAGNRSDVRTEAFIIDTMTPTLSVSTLSDHSFTNDPVLNVAGSVTDNVGVKELHVNNTVVPFNADGSFSYPVVLADGDNLIVVSASDLAGRAVSDSRTITLDRKAPQLVITSPSDNGKTGEQLVAVTGYVDELSTVTVKLGSGSQIATMNGQDFNSDLYLSPGNNTIEVTAIDRAGNSNTQKRTVLYDNQIPSVAITVPDKDIRTNQASLLLKGTATDPYTAVSVSLFMDGQTFSPAVTNGQFEQLLSFTTEKTYTVAVTAANEVGRTATVQRNVIYDTTAPVLAINPVATPTAQSSQIVTGIRESDLSVQVTCPTATVGAISYPSATTWSVELTGLQTGDNSITATSTDAAGNVAAVSTRITVAQAAEPIFSHAVFGNKWVKLTGGSFTDSYAGVPSSDLTEHREHDDVDDSGKCDDNHESVQASHVVVHHEHGTFGARGRFTGSHYDESDFFVASQHNHGDVGTNSVQICAISLTGGSRIYGVADVGMGGSVGTGVCLTPGTAVSGGKAALAAFKKMAPKPDLGGGASSGAINLNNVAVKTLTTGNYRFSSIRLNGFGKLVISGRVVLHVDGDITLNGAGIIQITAGSSLMIYANGAKLDIGGGAIANASQKPNNLVIYGSALLTTVKLSGSTTLHGYLYAPAADIKISGGQQIFGSIIGNTVELSGGASVHYPEGLNANGLYN